MESKELFIKVQYWIKGEDYTEGLRLWKRAFGENVSYKLLCLGPSDFNRDKLRTGLLSIEDSKPAAAENQQSNSDMKEAIGELGDTVGNLATDVGDLDDSVRDLYEKVETLLSERRVDLPVPSVHKINPEEPKILQDWRKSTHELMDERVLLKQRLRDLPDPDKRSERKDTAFRILDITSELDRLFGLISYYEEFGRIPEDEPQENDSVLFPKAYLNIRTYISRTKKKLNQETDPLRKAQLVQKLKDYELKRKELEIDIT